ncbi:lysozyme [Hyphomicrobium sp. 99]|uniref:lysozyme n=1 Tax=Hyphomicrobium sp. 99 TaxID=1163419 RepID=UPI0005F7F89B|nr:lysozyme [Hyphomicrobium sp. 99]
MVDASYLNAIKQFEGYAAKARWDYAQNTNGYGTRARFAGEVIDEAEAERRFSDEIKKAADFVDKFAPGLDDGSKAALTSLTYNAGTAWTQSGLGKAIASGDLDAARSLFLQYNKAGGNVLDGLVQRRLQEVAWFGQGVPTTQVASASLAAMAAAASGASAASESALSDATPASSVPVSVRPRIVSTASTADMSVVAPFVSLTSDQVLLSLLSHMANAGAGRDDGDTKKSDRRSDQRSQDRDVGVKTG